MKPDRLNALTDGVIAIVLTIMVLELKFPAESNLAAVYEVLPLLAAYLLAFVNIGIFWNNHHHMLSGAKKVNGAVLWANLSLLFWLTLVPFVIRWIGEVGITAWPVAAYGLLMIGSALSYLWLEHALMRAEGDESNVRQAVGAGLKEKISLTLYLVAVPAAFLSPYISVAAYVAVAITWLIPDRRFEQIV